VESEAEHRCCCEIGFELGQGYYTRSILN